MLMEDDVIGSVEVDLPHCTKYQAIPSWTLLEPEGALEYKAFVHPKMDVDSSLSRPRFPSFFVIEVHSATDLTDALTLTKQVFLHLFFSHQSRLHSLVNRHPILELGSSQVSSILPRLLL